METLFLLLIINCIALLIYMIKNYIFAITIRKRTYDLNIVVIFSLMTTLFILLTKVT